MHSSKFFVGYLSGSFKDMVYFSVGVFLLGKDHV